MFKDLETDDIELLNVIIYEEDMKISRNLYDKEKMSYLVEKIGERKCLSLLTPPYDDLLMHLLSNNYKINNSNLKELGTGEWKVQNFTRSLKKVQKHLELYFLDNIYPTSDEVKMEYDNLFGPYTKTLGLKDIIDTIYDNRYKSNESNKLYNQDVAYIKNYFEKNPDIPGTIEGVRAKLDDILKGLVSNDMINRVHINRQHISFTIEENNDAQKCIDNLKKDIKNAATDNSSKNIDEKINEMESDIKKKRNKIMKNISSCIDTYKMLNKLSCKTILNNDGLEAFRRHNENYYKNIIKELNMIYGYERYFE